MGRGRGIGWARALAGALWLGCGGTAPAPDAGVEDAAIRLDAAGVEDAGLETATPPAPPTPPAEVAPIDPAAPPVALDCAPWDRVTRGDAAVCAPWAGASVVPDCAAGERPSPAGCLAVGAPCPPASELWRADLPATGVLYVRPGAAGGDGTRAAPFGTVAEAAAAAPPGAVIALAAGRFEEQVDLPSGVELRGRCARDTVIAPRAGIAVASPAGGALRDLTIESSDAAVAVSSGTLRGSGLRVAHAGSTAIDVSGDGRIELGDAVIEAPASPPGAEVVRARGSAELALSSALVRYAEGAGVGSRDGAAVELVDVVLVGSRERTAAVTAARLSGLTSTLRRVAATELTIAEGGAVEADHLALVERGSLRVAAGARMRVRGLFARGGDVFVTERSHLDVRDGLGWDEGTAGLAFAIQDASSVHLERLHLEVLTRGISLRESSAELRDLTILRAAWVGGAVMTARASQIGVERARLDMGADWSGSPIVDLGEGSRLTGRDLAIHGDGFHTGVEVADGSVEVERLHVAATCPFGLLVERSSVTVSDATFTDLSDEIPYTTLLTEEVVVGIYARGASQVDVRRARVTDSAGTAFGASGAGTRLSLEDVHVERLRGRSDLAGSRGYAVLARSGALVEARRVEALHARSAAFRVAPPGATLLLADALVDGVDPDEDGVGGRALDVGRGGRVEVDRLEARGAIDVAVLVAGTGATATLRDLRVADVRGRAVDGTLGHGIAVAGAARVTVERALVEGARELGVAVFDPFSRVEATDLSIATTRPRACAETTCRSSGGGIGLGVYDEAEAALTRFSVRDGALAGIQLARRGAVDLSLGEVRGHPVGVNLQVEGYDLARLTDRVRYLENALTFDADSLPVPAPAAPLED